PDLTLLTGDGGEPRNGCRRDEAYPCPVQIGEIVAVDNRLDPDALGQLYIADRVRREALGGNDIRRRFRCEPLHGMRPYHAFGTQCQRFGGRCGAARAVRARRVTHRAAYRAPAAFQYRFHLLTHVVPSDSSLLSGIQRPTHFGSRFSRKAFTPSRASSDCRALPTARCSITISDWISASRPRSMVILVSFMANGLLSTIGAMKSATSRSSSAAGAEALIRSKSAASQPFSSLPVSISSLVLRIPIIRGSR